MKKVLLLGGSRYLIPVINKIHELGHIAITCDYLPNNTAHKYSDEYYNISIIEKEKIEVTDADLDARLEEIAKQYGKSLEDMKKALFEMFPVYDVMPASCRRRFQRSGIRWTARWLWGIPCADSRYRMRRGRDRA